MGDDNQATDADVISLHPVDPLVKVIAALDVSSRTPRFTPTMATVAILPALLFGMLLGPWGAIPWLFGSYVLFWLVVTLIHELGHFAVALIAGFRIHMFAVGPFAIVRNGRSFRVMQVSSWVFSGYVLSTPNDPDKQKRWLATFSIAGCFANLATGGLAWYAHITYQDTSWISLWAKTFIIFSIGFGLSNSIPYRIGAFASDGLGLVRLLGMGSDADQFRAARQLVSEQQRGLRPRDWDANLLTTALGHDGKNTPMAGAAFLAYLNHLDAGRDAEAAQFLERTVTALKFAPLLFSAELFAEAAYFFAQHGSDPALARAILERIDGENVNDLMRLRAEASVLLAEGNVDLATQVAQRAINLTDDWPGAEVVAIERELIHRLLMLASSMPEMVSSSANSNSELSAIVVPAL